MVNPGVFSRKIQIATQDFVLTSAIQNYLDTKIKKIESFVNKRYSEFLMEIMISRISHHRHGVRLLMILNLKFGRSLIRSEEPGEDVYELIDKVVDEVLRQLRTEKDKFLSRQRQKDRQAKAKT